MTGAGGASGRLPAGESEAPKQKCPTCRFWRWGFVLTFLALALTWWFGARG